MLPSKRWHLKQALGFKEVEDLPITLQNIDLSNTNLGHEALFLTLAVNNLFLHKFMLYSWTSKNIMPLKVTKQLNLEITCKYKNLCGFDSKYVDVKGIFKDLKVSLDMNKDTSSHMDVVVIDIPNVWGMVLSRKWGATMGGQLQIHIYYATIL